MDWPHASTYIAFWIFLSVAVHSYAEVIRVNRACEASQQEGSS